MIFLAGKILALKAKGDPLIFIGGDLNRRSIAAAIQDFPDISQANFDPTRGLVCLDAIFTNATGTNANTWPPLETPEGIKSDHSCVVVSGHQPKEKTFHWAKKTTRRQTERAVQRFGEIINTIDWPVMLPPSLGPNEMVEKYETMMTGVVDDLSPITTTKLRSNEDPWITDGIRRLYRKKCRVYKREGKSRLWCTLRDLGLRLIEESKAEYVDRAAAGGTSSRAYYTAIKSLSSKHRPKDWSVLDLFPGKSPGEAGEETASYFTRITDLFRPLDPPEYPTPFPRKLVSLDEVRKKLKDAKKPDSSVDGDIPPRLMRKYHESLAVPVRLIFNAVFSTGTWPSRWKSETTVVIPKSQNPETLAGCRNISCTPFLSKVLESFLLDDLRGAIPPDPTQYGGIGGCSVNHLLVDMFEDVLGALESGKNAIVLGIDFEKAFNRLDHRECVRQLQLLGADRSSVALVHSFLEGRCMRVKIAGELSDPRPLSGGSPQGSILGCYLYCAVTQQLNCRLPTRPTTNNTSPQPPAQLVTSDSETTSGGFGILGTAAPGFDDSSSSNDSFHSALGSLPDGDRSGELVTEANIEQFKYVDDTTLVETTNNPPIRHIAGTSPTEELTSILISGSLQAIIDRAGDIGMVVNCGKTQMVCISPQNGYTTSSVVHTDEGPIRSTSSIKLLGFVMCQDGGLSGQVDLIKDKFRRRFWALIHLRRSGIVGFHLFRLYSVLVRPILESNAIIMHPMLGVGQEQELERMQKQALRLCFGNFNSYDAILEDLAIPSLKTRRTEACTKFVRKLLSTRSPFANKWLIRRPEVENDLRQRRPFIEGRARTERYRKSPLLYIQRIANDIMTAR